MKRSEFFLNSSEKNPRNSEGSFLSLNDGRIIFVFSRYCGDTWDDNANADLACCYSSDDGISWSDPQIMIEHSEEEGGNLMSVSLLRLHNGRIIMIYLAKKMLPNEEYPCFVVKYRYSDDECQSWSQAKSLTSCRYNMVVNNDRLVQLSGGRIIVPVACIMLAATPKGIGYKPVLSSLIYSDDNGESWFESCEYVYPPANSRSGTQEPGVIELADGRLIMWMRTDLLCQYHSYSNDQGDTWTPALPWKPFPCTVTPLSIKRDPADNKLVAVWSDGDPRWGVKIIPEDSWDRTPFAMAISRDEGKTWGEKILIEDDPRRGYCYTAIHFTEKAILLAYCCGGYGKGPLQDLKITRIVRDK